ncbi:MAG: peptidylprolyl isomerase [Bacteroidales bacterium]|nr:peptidylprolyl isomerase [Bacteroidales bacterium]
MNRTFLQCALLAVALCLLMPAKAQRYNNGLVDKIVALVGNEMIQLSTLESEVHDMMAMGVISDKNIRCQVLENLLIQKLLLTQAKLDSLSTSEGSIEAELENKIQQYKTHFGSEKAVEEYFNKPIFRIKQDWREQLQEQLLTMEMQRALQAKIPVLTPSEVEKFYRQTDKDSLPIIPIQYQLRQIVFYPSKEDAVLAVKEELLNLRERVMNGENFGMLAASYSMDPGSALRRGELGMTSKQFFWPMFSDAAMGLRPGQVSQIVETPDGFHIIQLIEKDGDMFNARHILRKPQFGSDVRVKAFNKLDSLKNLITKDSLSFETAATHFSMDPKSSRNNGLLADENTGSTYFEKDQLSPTDYNAIRNLKPGEISLPYESTDFGSGVGFSAGRPNDGRSGNTVYKIIKLEKILPAHTANLKEDYPVILEFARNRHMNDIVEEFISDKQKTTYMVIDPIFSECTFQRSGWIK